MTSTTNNISISAGSNITVAPNSRVNVKAYASHGAQTIDDDDHVTVEAGGRINVRNYTTVNGAKVKSETTVNGVQIPTTAVWL